LAASNIEALVELTLDRSETLLVVARQSEVVAGLAEQLAALGGETGHAAIEGQLVSTDRGGHAVPSERSGCLM
jgi:hypothetical protein